MEMTRCSGILAHIPSLPSRFGIGGTGAETYRFIDYLASGQQKLWQILPLGPTGFGDSPYQSFSAFAGNPFLVCPEKLVEEGYLSTLDLLSVPDFSNERVDFAQVFPWKMSLFRKAAQLFQKQATETQSSAFRSFCESNSFWLDDFALFMALKRVFGGREWCLWDKDIATRQPKAMGEWKGRLASEITLHKFIQFEFFRQWKLLKKYAEDHGVSIFGDVPIFLSADSSDVWAHPELFYLDESGHPTVVAGVPPDYFSETGQLWGNPLYRWEIMKQTGYSWWVKRFQKTLELFDFIRIDHFRGFEAYWEIPAGEKTAVQGRWVKGPGMELFEKVQQALGPLPIIAENLGLITPEVEILRRQCGFPGMAVLQFAFSGSDSQNPHLPHNYHRRLVAYTGTHDNDTTRGWWESLHCEDQRRTKADRLEEIDFLCCYLTYHPDENIHWTLIRAVESSVADWAVIPLQDVLGLGSEARMNQPATASGNWYWRVAREKLTPEVADVLKKITTLYGRK
jgi:4-alpha-glucanotransferase